MPDSNKIDNDQLQCKEFSSWDEFKGVLSTLYQDKRHYILLMEELNTLKQEVNESVVSFHDRVDKITLKLLNTMQFKSTDEQLGKVETIKELALSRFIHHSKPDVSTFLRAQVLNDICIRGIIKSD